MTDCLSFRERMFAVDADATDAATIAHVEHCPECRAAYHQLPHLRRALDEIGRLPVVVPDFGALAGVAAGAARKQRRRRLVHRSAPFFYTGLGAAALAAGVVAIVLIGRAAQPATKLLVPGAEIHAAGEAKSAVLSNGVRIRLESGTLRLAATSAQTQSLALPFGRVSLDVPRLPVGSTLAVRTPEAEVRVHGTRFQVARTAQDTQVHVLEGVVEVRPDGIGRPPQIIRAGESTTVGAADSYRDGLRSATLAALDHGEFSAAEKEIGQWLGTGATPAQQAEAKALLAWSLSARGQRSAAIARYREALALLPDGQRPLWAENACAELAILIEQQSPKDAAAAWSQCLRRFPDGVHAASARSRVNSTK